MSEINERNCSLSINFAGLLQFTSFCQSILERSQGIRWEFLLYVLLIMASENPQKPVPKRFGPEIRFELDRSENYVQVIMQF